MELHQLKTFVVVAEEGHLTRAAKLLHASQPAVSAHIKSLESELDVILFTRTPKGMVLTDAGNTLKIQAQKTLESVDNFQLQARAMKERLSGVIKFGLHINPIYLKINELFSFARDNYPGLEFHFKQNMTWDAVNDVSTGVLDCAYVYGQQNDNQIETVVLKKIPTYLAGPIQWENKIKKASWKEIEAMPWITTPNYCFLQKISKAVCEKAAIKPVSIAVADEENTLNNLVISEIGITLMVEHEAKDLEKNGKVALWNKQLPGIELSFIYNKRRRKDPALKAVLDTVQAIWKLA